VAKNQAGLKKLVFDFAKISKENKSYLRKNMRAIGKPTLQKIQASASWSRRIPGSTKMGVGFTTRNTGIRIQTDRHVSPHARPHEHAGEPGTFRHPLFGDDSKDRKLWTWYSQPAKPYMYPSAVEDLPDIADRMLDVLMELCHKNGFTPS
jgi:hypothetical protein